MQSANIISIAFTPWRKYSDYFDKNCWGIWGLSPTLKFTFIYFGLFILDLFISDKFTKSTQETIELFFTLGIIALFIVWAIYIPILCLILISNLIKKSRLLITSAVKLLTYPTDKEEAIKKKPSDLEIIARGLKSDLNSLLYKVGGWLTRYYPFSLLFTDRLFHPKNAKLDKFVIKIAKLARKNKVPIYIHGSEIEGNMYQLNAVFHEPVKGNSLKKLETVLQKLLGTVYVRRGEKKQIRILMPTEIMNLYITDK